MLKKLLSVCTFGALILFLCASVNPPKQTAILFDLNGVLFRLSKMKSLQHLGIGTTISYIMQGGKMDTLEMPDRHTTLEGKLFAILHQLDPEELPNEELMPLHKNAVLPKIMRDWLAGTVDSYDAITRIHNQIDYLASRNEFFINKTEIDLMKKIATLVFDPEVRAEIYKPIKKGVDLVKSCKKRGYEVYLISNMDTKLVELLQEMHPEIFELFDGKIISAEVNTIKPYPDIYMYTLLNYNLDPDNCYLIDDQHENLLGAEAVGIDGFLCDHRKYKNVVKAMKKEGLLEKANLKKKHVAKIAQDSRGA
jgi:putative hydrolase of the HAD superfamily